MKKLYSYRIYKIIYPNNAGVMYNLEVKSTHNQRLFYRLYNGNDFAKLLEVGNKYGLPVDYNTLVTVFDFSTQRGLNVMTPWILV